jgi:cytochrome c553
MNMNATIRVTALIAALSGISCAQAGGDPVAGKKKAEEVCVACHGVDGNSASDMFPKVAGQHEDYMIAALHKYKNGKRANPIMAGMAAALSEEDVKNVSAWYSRQSGLQVKY